MLFYGDDDYDDSGDHGGVGDVGDDNDDGVVCGPLPVPSTKFPVALGRCAGCTG